MEMLKFSRACLDETVAPGDDFYQYSMGGWLKKNPVPPEEARWSTFDMLQKKVSFDLKEIAETAAKKKLGTKEEKMVGDFWKAALDEKQREKIGASPLHSLLAEIRALKNQKDVERFIAKVHQIGIDALWAPYVSRDDKNSEKETFHLAQAGLSLPDRDYYLKDDAESKRIRSAYLIYIPRLLTHCGYTKSERERIRDIVLRIETELAKASMTRVERRNPQAQYNRRTVRTLLKEAPHVDWQGYLNRIGAAKAKTFTVCQPKFMACAGELLAMLPVTDWQAYLTWKTINGSASYLTKAMGREAFEFYGKTLSGAKKRRPLWERAIGVIDGSVGDALAKLYVQKHFTPDTKRRMDNLVKNLFVATRERIGRLEWMSSTTKKKALQKLSSMKRKIGYPSRFESYRGVDIRKNEYFGNIERAHVYAFRKMMRRIDKKPETWRWYMTAPTVNAYYDPNANEIAFPAGILQPPFFDPAADDALNYGAIGTVIGHEITHAFDDEGRQFDAKGNMRDWWTKEDAKRFEARAEVLRKQYDAFVVIDGMHVNGKLTLGENIADLGGLLIAYDAFIRSQKGKVSPLMHGLTPEQRFFFGWSLFEVGNVRPEFLKRMILTDVHSPGRFRVNGSMPNVDVWYKAFAVTQKHKLFIAPAKRARIW